MHWSSNRIRSGDTETERLRVIVYNKAIPANSPWKKVVILNNLFWNSTNNTCISVSNESVVNASSSLFSFDDSFIYVSEIWLNDPLLISFITQTNTFNIIRNGDIRILPFECIKGVVVGGLDEFDVIGDFVLGVDVEGELAVGDVFVGGHWLGFMCLFVMGVYNNNNDRTLNIRCSNAIMKGILIIYDFLWFKWSN